MEKVIAWGEAVQKMARELIDRVQKKYPPGKSGLKGGGRRCIILKKEVPG